MPDIIKLLPDHVINQIAAGEVIQRPASVVKELLENAIDAGANKIKLIVKDAGKNLIQVIDDGNGMSDTDARMSFEKHATSKISTADDIFRIVTKGFRGEALASIAAIAAVELKTCKTGTDAGTRIDIEYGKVKRQEPCQCLVGSSFSIKNLFFNTPARKSFLKSDTAELRHIIEELSRVAIPHPGIEFLFYNNDRQEFHLTAGNTKQRLAGLFGTNYGERIIPVAETTTILKISGYTGKPEYSRKTRGEQYFFVNGRYIRNNYLHHAVASAYAELIPKDVHPVYFIFLDVLPEKIDVNIHPTKTEVKFEDESSIYAILKSSVKKALGQNNIMPSLNFEQEMAINIKPLKPNEIPQVPVIKINSGYNPFATVDIEPQVKMATAPVHADIKRVFQPAEVSIHAQFPPIEGILTAMDNKSILWSESWDKQYIVAQYGENLLIIDSYLARERIYYEQAIRSIEKNQKFSSQKELFPQTLIFPSNDFSLLKEMEEELKCLGFELSEFGKQTFIVYGVPPGIDSGSVQGMLEEIIDDCKHSRSKELKKPGAETLAKSYAKRLAHKNNPFLTPEEREELIRKLFGCETPSLSLDGKRIFLEISKKNIFSTS